jgi:predicted Abi (CAAX) family protease
LTTATSQPGILTTPIVPGQAATRYVVYLDGVGQSKYQHLPSVERFLEELEIILPDDIRVIKGIMPYSVLNNPLTVDRPLAFFWRLTEQLRLSDRASILSFLVNLRNVLVVAVSADQRYGPIYNQGIAQVIHNGLIYHGYQPNSGIPITLIGYSGGGQLSAAAAPFLRDSLKASIDIISLGGVISGNVNLLEAEHLYHLVGKRDIVERLGAVMFPRRWNVFFLSYWNRVKRRGKISFISLGPVGHNVPGGLFDANRRLPDGRTYLQQTLEWVADIIQGFWLPARSPHAYSLSNYDRYQQSKAVHPDYYPLDQSIDPEYYRPIANWMGRLILPKPEQRHLVQGVLFEVYHTESAYSHLIGKVVYLRWSKDPSVQVRIRAVTQDLHFSEEADFTQQRGVTHPERLNHWRRVDPLESLAGAHPVDDIVVMLSEPIAVDVPAQEDEPTILSIWSEPIQITGRFYALVRFMEPASPSDHFQVIHYNRTSQSFDGVTETVCLPPVIPNKEGIALSTSQAIERSPLNQNGWYIYGAKNALGTFVVQAIAPRSLFQLQPNQVVIGRKAASHYIKKTAWANLATQKGRISSVLLCPQQRLKSEIPEGKTEEISPTQAAIAEWQEGDTALLVHVYGGIGGNKRETPAKGPVYFGHFAYGTAEVIRDPLTDELRFELVYRQVYTHNTDGLVAGSLHWSRYMGDRQFGWLGTRPVSDILIKFEAFTEPFDLGDSQRSPLDLMTRQLEVMTARYRIGDGTGATYVGPANNCAQDSNQALYASIRNLESFIRRHQAVIEQWSAHSPDQVRRYQQLLRLEQSIKRKLMLFGLPRPDWEENALTLGNTLEDAPLQSLLIGLGSWRTMLPRLASDTIVTLFLRHGAAVWVLRTNQVGGWDSDIEPIAPMTLTFIS